MNTQRYFIPTTMSGAGNNVVKVEFVANTLVINNTTDSIFKVYVGEVSIGMGIIPFDYKVDPYSFAELPLHGGARKVTIEWTAPTKQFDYIRLDMLEEKRPFFIQANPPTTGGSGVAQNVAITSPIPAGTANIGKVNLGTSDVDISKNGAPISGEVLSSGGSDSLGWLSEIAKRIKTNLTATITGALPTGGNSIGNVGLNTGVNNIGKVDINSLPALPAGSANIGKVDTPSLAQTMTVSPITKQIALVASTITPLRVGASDLAGRKQILIYNMDTANTVFIGDSAVSATNGFPLKANGTFAFDQNPANVATVYAFSPNALSVAVMEVS